MNWPQIQPNVFTPNQPHQVHAGLLKQRFFLSIAGSKFEYSVGPSVDSPLDPFTLDDSVATLGKRRDLGRVAISRPLVGSLLGSKGRTSHREMRLAQDFFSFVKWLIFPGFSFNSIVLIYAPMHGSIYFTCLGHQLLRFYLTILCLA